LKWTKVARTIQYLADQFAKFGIPAAFPFSGSEYVGKPKEFGDAKWLMIECVIG